MSDQLALITTTQVAERFKVNASAVRRWVAKGQLKPAITTPGGHYRFSQADIDAFMSAEASA